MGTFAVGVQRAVSSSFLTLVSSFSGIAAFPGLNWVDWELTDCKAQVFCEGEQDMPPQNIPLWYKGYSELIIFKKQQTKEKL